MNQILNIVGKFWFPALCIIVSLVLLYSGFSGPEETRQSNLALFGTLAILLIGVFSIFFLLDMLKKPAVMVLTLVFALGAAFFGYNNYKTIDKELKYTKEKAHVKSQMIQRLKDVRTAQLAYLEVNGTYTNDWNRLKNFVKTGKMQTVKQIGEVPDTLSTSQAVELGLFQKRPAGMSDDDIIKNNLLVRDTIYENALKVLFENEKSMEKRKHPLDLDRFEYAPGGGDTKLELRAGMIEISGGGQRPVFAVKDPKPFPGLDTLQVGSMTDAVTNGNWKE